MNVIKRKGKILLLQFNLIPSVHLQAWMMSYNTKPLKLLLSQAIL